MQTQPHSSLQNASGRDDALPSRLTRLNRSAGLSALAAPPPKFMKTTNRLLSLVLALLCLAVSWQGRAANIVFVSNNPNTTGFTMDPIAGTGDDQFVTMLQAAGHSVIRFSSDDSQNVLLTQEYIDALNTNDLIIVGRSAASTAFQSPQGNQWNTAITKPLLCQNAYLTRNSRFGWFGGNDTIPDNFPVPLTVVSSLDPTNAYLFGAAPLAGSIMAGNYDVLLGQNTSHTSASNAPAAGGKVLATAAATNGTTLNVIVEFPAGTVVKGTDTLAGYRIYMASGNREYSGGAVSQAGSNNLTSAGQAIFLRAVNLALASGVPPNLGAAPVVTTQPVAIAACAGSAAALSVVATGQDPIFYQWFQGATPVADGTNATLSFPNLQAANEGTYTVVVSNLVSTATSDPATVAITGTGTVAPAIPSQIVCPGLPATFTTAATGSGTLNYTWRKGDAIVQGPDTQNSYTIASVAPADAGAYSVTVVGDCNIASNNFALAVAAAPAITAQPQNGVRPQGNSYTFSVTATSPATLAAPTFQWYFNGVTIAGANASTLPLSDLYPTNSGLYQLVVANCAGSSTSLVASLIVTPVSGITVDFETVGQYTNYFVNSTLPANWIEDSTNGPAGRRVLDHQNINDGTSVLLPIAYDFSQNGKLLGISLMVKSKTPNLFNNRFLGMGFVNRTNAAMLTTDGDSYMSMKLNSVNSANFPDNGTNNPVLQVESQTKVAVGTATIQRNVTTNMLTKGNWYRVTATFLNNKTAIVDTYLAALTIDDWGSSGSAFVANVLSTNNLLMTNANLTSDTDVYAAWRSIDNGGADLIDDVVVFTKTGSLVINWQPQSQTVLQGRSATFDAYVDGDGPYTYQWYKNGSPIAGANDWRYTTPPAVSPGDNVATYHFVATSASGSVTSDMATLTVTPDVLNVASVGSLDGWNVGVRFDQAVTSATAANPANYSIAGTTVNAAQLRPDGRSVQLFLTTQISGAFAVTVSGVQDFSGNTIASPNDTGNGSVSPLRTVDINNPAPVGSVFSAAAGEYEIIGGGADVWGTADQFTYTYEPRTGDFDVKVLVTDETFARGSGGNIVKAGLNIRESLEPSSRTIHAIVSGSYIGRNNYEAGTRREFAGGTGGWDSSYAGGGSGNVAATHPNSWMRFRRVGNSFISYSGTNGVDWSPLTVTAQPYPETVYLGLEMCSHAQGYPATATFRGYGDYAGYPGAVLTIVTNIAPSSTNRITGDTAIFAVSASVTGAPVTEIAFLWQGSADGGTTWTNIAAGAGGTYTTATGVARATYTTPALTVANNGAQIRSVVKVNGAADVTSSTATINVTDAAGPSLTGATVYGNYVVIAFNEAVDPVSGTAPGNYSVTNSTGSIGIVSAHQYNANTIVLVLNQPLDIYLLAAGVVINNVTDVNGNLIAINSVRSLAPYRANQANMQFFGNLGGSTIATPPPTGTPTWEGLLNSFGFGTSGSVINNMGLGNQENYFGRMVAYFIPPTNGLYHFYIRHDDAARLYMVTNNSVNVADPANKVTLLDSTAVVGNYGTAGNFIRGIDLQANRPYYLEALIKEGTGGDYMATTLRVGAQADPGSGQNGEQIAGTFLAATNPFVAWPVLNLGPSNATVAAGQPLTLLSSWRGGPITAVRWYKIGSLLPSVSVATGNGGTGSYMPYTSTNVLANLNLVAARPEDSGTYYVVASTPFANLTSAPVTVTVGADATLPTLVAANTDYAYRDVVLTFSEKFDVQSALNLANYSISGLTVQSAAVDESGKRVKLYTSLQTPGTTYTVTVNGVRDLFGNQIAGASTISFMPLAEGPYFFKVEVYTNLQGTLPQGLLASSKYNFYAPDYVVYTTNFGWGTSPALNYTGPQWDNYGVRVAGYFVAPSNGVYRFFLKSDDSSQFYLNPNGTDPAGKVLIAEEQTCCKNWADPAPGGPRVSNGYGLNAGQSYFFEFISKEGGGGDWFRVTWREAGQPNPTDQNEIASARDFRTLGDPNGRSLLVTGPASPLAVVENQPLPLAVVAVATPANTTVIYQWQLADGIGGYTNIPGATLPTLNRLASLAEDNAVFRAVVAIPGISTNVDTLVTVALDVTAPFVVSASSLNGTNIDLTFNEKVDPVTGADYLSYTVNDGSLIYPTAAVMKQNGLSVTLTLSESVGSAGTPFSVSWTAVQDTAASPNAGDGTTNGYVQGFVPQDLGAPAGPGSSFSAVPGEIDVIAGGNDIWGTSDVGHFTLTPRSGDFDIWTQVQSLSRAPGDNDGITKAGLVVRQTYTANSQGVQHLAEPPASVGGRDIYEAGQRATVAGGMAAWAGGNGNTGGPAGIPNTWIRIKRTGNLFTAFRSADGTNWLQTTTNLLVMTDPVLVGLGTTAHVPVPSASTTLAQYRNIHIPLPPVILTQPTPVDLTVGLGASVSYTVVASNQPNSGTMTFQWFQNGVKMSGQTSDTLSLTGVGAIDSGIYTVKVANDGGATISVPVTLTVNNQLPAVVSDAITVTQNTPFTFLGASLLSNDNDPDGAPLSLLGVNGVCAGLVMADFSRILPAGATNYGSAYVDTSIGALKINDGAASQAGSVVFNELSPGTPVAGFTASFKLRIADGNVTPADGISFNFAGNLPDAAGQAYGESGAGSGFSFCIDSYNFAPYPAGGTANTSGMKIRYNGLDIVGVQTPTWINANFIPVSITLATNGAVTVLVDGTNVFPNLVIPYVPATGRFGIYARTGGSYEAHWLDDLNISVVNRTPRGGLVSLDQGTGSVTYTPPANACGTDSFVYYAADGQVGGVTCGTVNVQINEETPTAPVITTCAPDRTYMLYTTNKAVLPDLTAEVVATDNCTFSLSQSPVSGTLLSAGTNIVTITATDSMGLTASCQVAITVVVTSPDVIPGSPTYTGTAFSSSFQTSVGVNYVVEYKDDLSAPAWTTLIVIPGDGTAMTFTDPGPLPPTRFYRVTAQ